MDKFIKVNAIWHPNMADEFVRPMWLNVSHISIVGRWNPWAEEAEKLNYGFITMSNGVDKDISYDNVQAITTKESIEEIMMKINGDINIGESILCQNIE